MVQSPDLSEKVRDRGGFGSKGKGTAMRWSQRMTKTRPLMTQCDMWIQHW